MINGEERLNNFLLINYNSSLNGYIIHSKDEKDKQNLLLKEKSILENIQDIKGEFKRLKAKRVLFLPFEKSLKPLSSFRNITTELFLKIALNLSKSLLKLHQKNILHGNLTKESIFLDEDLNVYIFNFSNAIEYSKNSTGISSVFFKNLPLEEKSPEQLGRINSEVDLRADIYALGVVFYWLLLNKNPFKGENELETLHLILSKEINILDNFPFNISQLIKKCLQKSVLLRYQSISGLIYDLKKLNADYEINIELGANDISSRLQFPQKVYGRDEELKVLQNTFKEVKKAKNRTLFISGYSGVGKSSLIDEFRNKVVNTNCYFISSKFDQYNKNLPYFAINEAFAVLVEQLQTKEEKELEQIKKKVLKAIGENGKILIDVIPKLQELIGEQPEVQQLPANESENRFNQVFISFIKAVVNEESPLVLVVDDLQWMDLATLKLLENIINENSIEYLFILAAYRDNEIDSNHSLKNIIELNKNIKHLHLEPLKKDSLEKFLKDTLFLSKNELEPLVDKVYKKTGANPFFFRQFIKRLYEEELLFFDFEKSSWTYDINKIKQENITENVASFMLSQVKMLDEDSLKYLQVASCLGSTFDLIVLQKVVNESLEKIVEKISNVFTLGFLIPLDVDVNNLLELKNSEVLKVKFLHDQVQQAVYSTIEADELKQLHYKIGKLLLQEERLNYFEILSHLNFSNEYFSNKKDMFELMELNIHAANLSKKSTAYDSALLYLSSAKKLLEEFDLKRYHSTYVNILIDYVELLYLTGDFEKAKKCETKLFKIITSLDDEIRLRRVLTVQYTRVGKLHEAIDEGLKSLELLGVNISKDITMEDIQEEIKETQVLLKKTPFRKLATLEEIEDEKVLKVLDILMEMQPCSYNSGSLVFPITILRLLKLTILHGNSYLSYYIYMMYALMNTKVLKDYKTAFEASKYASQIKQKYGKSILTGRFNMMLANFVMPWEDGLLESSVLRKQAFEECLEFGDYYWGIHSRIFGFYADFLVSSSLDELYESTKNTAKLSQKIDQISQYYLCNMQMNFLDILRGKLDNFKNLNHKKDFEAKALEEYSLQNYMCGKYDFIVARLMQGFLFSNYQAALDISLPKNLDPTSLDEGIFHEAFYKVFNILSILILQSDSKIKRDDKKRYKEYLDANLPFIKTWKQYSSSIFVCFDFLIEAFQRVINKELESSIEFFEKAIEKANESDSIFLQALCNEYYGKFWFRRKNRKIGALYIQEAITIYNSWGAKAKAKNLQEKYIKQRDEQKSGSLDTQLIIDSSNIISKEIKLEKLIKNIMQIVYKFSGSQNGYIFLNEDEKLKLVAKLDRKGFNYYFNKKNDELIIPKSAISYVKRTKQVLHINDLFSNSISFDDEYTKKYKPLAILCLPLVLNEEIKGVIYLDNLEQKNIFLEQNIQMIKLLLSQMIISIENAYFYEKLEESVKKKTQALQDTLSLFDMGEMVLFEWKNSSEWPVTYVSNNVKKVLGYEKSDFLDDNLKYQDIIHKEDIETVLRELTEATCNKEEKILHNKYRLKHKSGEYIWIYDTTKIIYNEKNEANSYLGYLVDVTRQKKRETSAFQQTKMVALTEMISNIAHQWRQPLNVISTSISSLKVKKELDVLEENDIERTSDVVIQTVTNLSKTIDDFRNFLSVNKTLPQDNNLSSIIKKAYEMLSNSFLTNKIEVIFNLDENINYTCSQGQLIQVLINILTNAKDALLNNEKQMKLIFIELYRNKNSITIEIKDSAGGINKEIIGKIFDPYFTTKHQSQGTGLGLYLTHQMVINELNGDLEVENVDFEYKLLKYSGASFKITLLDN